MSIISKILILLGLITISLQKRCDNCFPHDISNCRDYLECQWGHIGFSDMCQPTYWWGDCCAEPKKGVYCARVQKGTKTPVCPEADADNLCEKSEFEFLE
jgi:hypothetical protein